ncbi:TPA: hypothetical protein HA231_03780 [Candidatus Woesearchaeota archaeon]|nr:hypothetical protein [Candidatus Woesearchaeota archaeon]
MRGFDRHVNRRISELENQLSQIPQLIAKTEESMIQDEFQSESLSTALITALAGAPTPENTEYQASLQKTIEELSGSVAAHSEALAGLDRRLAEIPLLVSYLQSVQEKYANEKPVSDAEIAMPFVARQSALKEALRYARLGDRENLDLMIAEAKRVSEGIKLKAVDFVGNTIAVTDLGAWKVPDSLVERLYELRDFASRAVMPSVRAYVDPRIADVNAAVAGVAAKADAVDALGGRVAAAESGINALQNQVGTNWNFLRRSLLGGTVATGALVLGLFWGHYRISDLGREVDGIGAIAATATLTPVQATPTQSILANIPVPTSTGVPVVIPTPVQATPTAYATATSTPVPTAMSIPTAIPTHVPATATATAPALSTLTSNEYRFGCYVPPSRRPATPYVAVGNKAVEVTSSNLGAIASAITAGGRYGPDVNAFLAGSVERANSGYQMMVSFYVANGCSDIGVTTFKVVDGLAADVSTRYFRPVGGITGIAERYGITGMQSLPVK